MRASFVAGRAARTAPAALAALMAGLCVPLLLCGCGAPGKDAAPEAAAKTITLLSFPDQPKSTLSAILSEAGLGFDVEIIEVPQNQYERKTKLLLMSDEAPDLMLVDSPNVASYANSGTLEPMDAWCATADYADLLDMTQKSVQWNGSIWCAPLNEASCVLFYNKQIFDSEGIEPARSLDEAWSMDKLLEVAIRLTERDPNGNVTRYGLQPSMFAPGNKVEGMAYTQMLFTWWFGAEVISEGRDTADGYFNSPQNLAALSYYADLFCKYEVAPAYELHNGFENGKIAMWINGPWMLSTWRASFPDFYEDGWGAMPLPRGAQPASASGSWNVAISKASRNKDEAWQALYALTGPDGMKRWCGETGNVPARKSLLESEWQFHSEGVYQIVYEQLLKTNKIRPSLPQYPLISEALIDCYNSVAFGAAPEKAMADASEKMNEALGIKRSNEK
jgi:fructooligosaccharide transport system substrate-binding protein